MSWATFSRWNFLVLSPLTESSGHLLRDDAFWFGNLSVVDPRTTIITSAASSAALRRQYPSEAMRCREFRDVSWAKRFGFRVYYTLRLLSLPPICRRWVVIQAFEEVSLLLYLLWLRQHDNHVVLVLTNNVSPERVASRPKILAFLLREIFMRVDVVFYHSDFEFGLIQKLLVQNLPATRFAKLKYHLIGEGCELASEETDCGNVITFFGPASAVKPISSIYSLIEADKNKLFKYIFINISDEDANMLRDMFADRDNIIFFNGYLSNEEYQKAMRRSHFVFLPHNRLFEGKVSGIFSDCIANQVPIISDVIEPVIEYFRTYGSMGYICDYASATWARRFFDELSIVKYEEFKASMRNCSRLHSPAFIMNEFLGVLDSGGENLQQSI